MFITTVPERDQRAACDRRVKRLAAESGRRVPPTVAAANGTRTEAVHAWKTHAFRLGVRFKGTTSGRGRRCVVMNN